MLFIFTNRSGFVTQSLKPFRQCLIVALMSSWKCRWNEVRKDGHYSLPESKITGSILRSVDGSRGYESWRFGALTFMAKVNWFGWRSMLSSAIRPVVKNRLMTS